MNEERGKAGEGGVTKSPKATKVTKPKAAKQTKPSTPKASKVTKPADDKAPKHTSSQPPKSTAAPTKSSKKDQGVPEKEPAFHDEEANLQRALELSLKEQEIQGPARLVVIREPKSRKLQPLPERRTPMLTEPSGIAKSPSLDAELAPTDSEIESDKKLPPVNPEKDASHKELTEINAGDQDEGQAGPNPGEQEEGQAGLNPGDATES
ncbi:retrovirus-related pol polyprotein from transposon TNT 1-94 [Tanacetum coccineum]